MRAACAVAPARLRFTLMPLYAASILVSALLLFLLQLPSHRVPASTFRKVADFNGLSARAVGGIAR
jgi:hypothetical protein